MTIERQEFQKLLFKTSFCLMACDGHIHELEIKELKQMVKNTAYFHGIDLTREVENLLKEFKEKGKYFAEEVLNDLHRLKLSPVQELLVLEVAFRLVHADEKLDENEIKFIQFLRGKIRIPDELIRDRFGPVEYLFDKDYSNEIVKQETRNSMMDNFALSEINGFRDFNLNELDKNNGE